MKELSAFERGDHQTPMPLARRVLQRLKPITSPASVLEPTCGRGHFLVAAKEAFPDAHQVGYELSEARLAEARVEIPSAALHQGDVFKTDWARVIAELPRPLLIVGNPPWVTTGALSASENTPRERPDHGLVGLDAMTGASNFDLAEAITLRLLSACAAEPKGEVTLALLIKSSVARRLLASFARSRLATPVGLFRFDARIAFGVAVEACLFVVKSGAPATEVRCDVYASLEGAQTTTLHVADGQVRAGAEEARTFTLPPLAWRSGIKHDRVKVMELRRDGDRLLNGLGEEVDVESTHRYPLLKATDLAKGNAPTRELVVPQTRVGEPTDALPPKLTAYLERHAEALRARRSRVYDKQPPYAIFGVGPYSFADHKVAVSGLHHEPRFRVVSPHEGRPVVFDDTCYFVAVESASAAKSLAEKLGSREVLKFLGSHIFPGQKRPITKRLLSRLGE